MSTLNGGPGNIVTNGLVFYLDAANYLSYTSGSTVWRDLSSGNNSGSLINGPTFSSANGGSIVFDGVDDYVELGNVLNLGTNSLTVNTWFRTSDNTLNQSLMSKARAARQNYRWNSAIVTSKLYAFMQGNTPGFDIEVYGTTTVPSNTWVMGTFVYNRSSTIKLYYNGVEETTTGNSTISQWNNLDFQSNNPFRVGTYTSSDNTGILILFKGLISTTQVYFRVLSPSEILQNYNATKARFGL